MRPHALGGGAREILHSHPLLRKEWGILVLATAEGKQILPLHCVQGQDDSALGAFEVLFHAGEYVDGVGGVAADPAVVDFLDGQRVDVVPAVAAFAPDDDQLGFFKHSKMLHDGAAVQILEVPADVSRSLRLVSQQIEHFATAVIGQGFEDRLLPVALFLCD